MRLLLLLLFLGIPSSANWVVTEDYEFQSSGKKWDSSSCATGQLIGSESFPSGTCFNYGGVFSGSFVCEDSSSSPSSSSSSTSSSSSSSDSLGFGKKMPDPHSKGKAKGKGKHKGHDHDHSHNDLAPVDFGFYATPDCSGQGTTTAVAGCVTENNATARVTTCAPDVPFYPNSIVVTAYNEYNCQGNKSRQFTNPLNKCLPALGVEYTCDVQKTIQFYDCDGNSISVDGVANGCYNYIGSVGSAYYDCSGNAIGEPWPPVIDSSSFSSSAAASGKRPSKSPSWSHSDAKGKGKGKHHSASKSHELPHPPSKSHEAPGKGKGKGKEHHPTIASKSSSEWEPLTSIKYVDWESASSSSLSSSLSISSDSESSSSSSSSYSDSSSSSSSSNLDGSWRKRMMISDMTDDAQQIMRFMTRSNLEYQVAVLASLNQ